MSDEPSNTGEKQARKGVFQKGDPRINRKGRPKSFDALRALAQSIAIEPAVTNADGKPGLVLIRIPLTKNGAPVLDEAGQVVMIDHYATQVEMILRSWVRNDKRQLPFVEAAFGKVPQEHQVTGKDGGPIKTEDVTNYTDEERAARIAAILDKARTRRDRPPDNDDPG